MKKLNYKIKLVCLLLLTVFSTNSFGFKGDLRAIVKRPGKNELFVAGEFKTMFVLESKTGKTIRTFLAETGTTKLAFTKGGNMLLSQSGGKINFLDPENGTLKKTISGSAFFLFNNGSYFIDVDTYGKKINIYFSSDGALLLTQACDFQPDFVLLDSDEKQLHIFSKAEDINDESKLLSTKSVKAEGYNVFNYTYVKQEADGKGVKFFSLTISDKTISKVQEIPYSPSKGGFGSSFSSFKNQFYLLSYDSFYKMDKSGNATPIECKDAGFSYSATNSKDGKYVIQAGSKKGFVYNCETEKFASFELGKSFDKPYSSDIYIENDTIYMLSKDYSVDVFTTNGFIIRQSMINFEPNKGKFSVFYYNGYSKKEDRDKEALIINTLLKPLNVTEIDLEIKEPKDRFLASFNTVEEAANFCGKLKKEKLQYKTMIVPFEE